MNQCENGHTYKYRYNKNPPFNAMCTMVCSVCGAVGLPTLDDKILKKGDSVPRTIHLQKGRPTTSACGRSKHIYPSMDISDNKEKVNCIKCRQFIDEMDVLQKKNVEPPLVSREFHNMKVLELEKKILQLSIMISDLEDRVHSLEFPLR